MGKDVPDFSLYFEMAVKGRWFAWNLYDGESYLFLLDLETGKEEFINIRQVLKDQERPGLQFEIEVESIKFWKDQNKVTLGAHSGQSYVFDIDTKVIEPLEASDDDIARILLANEDGSTLQIGGTAAILIDDEGSRRIARGNFDIADSSSQRNLAVLEKVLERQDESSCLTSMKTS